MNAERMMQLQELMKEARQSGELEAALAATSVFPVPKRASRATVPLADYNMMKASMPKQMHVQVEQVTPNTVTITPKAQPKMQDTGPSLMATVAASSTQAPGMPVTPKAPIVSTAATNPTTTQGINRMRLAHERGDGVPTVVEAAKARARAAMFASPAMNWAGQPTGIQGGQPETQFPVPVKPAPPDLPTRLSMVSGNNKKNRVEPGPKREPAVISLQETILEDSDEENVGMGIHGAMTDASKRLRSPASSMFEERLRDFESDDWEMVEDLPPGHTTYTPILDPDAQAGGVSVGPYPASAPEAVRVQMANSHVPPDTMSYHEWGRTKILFGKSVRGLSYYQVAHGTEERSFYYRKWARTHLGNRSILGRDFVQYLAVKERYFGVEEDRQYLQMLQSQARAAATIPGTQQTREYVPEDDVWTTGGLA